MGANVGLVLEGGGMRGAFTAGVLDFFNDYGIEFPLVSTASSGALVGSYYVSKQRGKTYEILHELMKKKDTISFSRILMKKELFSMDFIFDRIPNEIVPLDFESFCKAKSQYIVATTELQSGQPYYYDVFKTKKDLLTVIRASSSLPILAKTIKYDGKELLDGGISDPIPIRPSIEHGCQKHVVILTRNRGYVKKPTFLNPLFKRVYKQYPSMQQTMRERHHTYNITMKMMQEMEQRKEVFFIQPEQPLVAKRVERKKDILESLYRQGYEEAQKKSEELTEFLNS